MWCVGGQGGAEEGVETGRDPSERQGALVFAPVVAGEKGPTIDRAHLLLTRQGKHRTDSGQILPRRCLHCHWGPKRPGLSTVRTLPPRQARTVTHTHPPRALCCYSKTTRVHSKTSETGGFSRVLDSCL